MTSEIPQCDMIIRFIQSDNTILKDFYQSLSVNPASVGDKDVAEFTTCFIYRRTHNNEVFGLNLD